MGFRSGGARVRAPRERNLLFPSRGAPCDEPRRRRRRRDAACIGDRDVSVVAAFVVCVVVCVVDVVCSGVLLPPRRRRRQRVLSRKTRGGDALTAAVTWCDLCVRCAPFDPIRVNAGGDFWAAFLPSSLLFCSFRLLLLAFCIRRFSSLVVFFLPRLHSAQLLTFILVFDLVCGKNTGLRLVSFCFSVEN